MNRTQVVRKQRAVDLEEQPRRPADPASLATDMLGWRDVFDRRMLDAATTLESRSEEEEDIFERLSAGGYSALEVAGRIKLTEEARGLLDGVLLSTHWHDPSRSRNVDAAERVWARKLGILARKLTRDERALFLTDYAQDLLLRGFSDAACLHLRKEEGGRPPHEHIDLYLTLLARVFRYAGGRVAISATGPFASFLMVAWEFLPKRHRPTRADTLVKRAKAILPELRKEA